MHFPSKMFNFDFCSMDRFDIIASSSWLISIDICSIGIFLIDAGVT